MIESFVKKVSDCAHWPMMKPSPTTPKIRDIAIDLGTATGLIYSQGSMGQITLEDTLGNQSHTSHIRTLVARHKSSEADLSRLERHERLRKERDVAQGNGWEKDNLDQEIEAVGPEAYERWGRTPEMEFVQAVKRGNIGDLKAYRAVLRFLIRMKYPDFKWSFGQDEPLTRILIGVPRNANEHHLNSIRNVIEHDIKAIPVLVWEQVAAAIGAKLPQGKKIPFQEPKSCFIADIGGGTLDFAILVKGKVVDQRSYETAGDNIDDAIVSFMRTKGIDIGYRTAITIKEVLGTAIPIAGIDDLEPHLVKGSSFQTQLPGKVKISRAEIRACIRPVLLDICRDFQNYLQSLSMYGDILSDIQENGFYFMGGTGMLPGLSDFISEQIGINVQLVENPMTAVIDGLIEMSTNKNLLTLGQVKQQETI